LRLLGIVLALLIGLPAWAETPAGDRPTGPVAAEPGTWILPNGRLITPAGRQTMLGNFPLGLAATPDGKYLIVVNNGAGPQSLQVVEAATGRIRQTLPVRIVFNGVVVSPDGRRVWAAGGGAQAVLEFSFADGKLTPAPSIPILGYPTGMALAPDGRTLYVTCNLSTRVAVLDTVRHAETGRITAGLLPFAIALTPDGRKAYVTLWGEGTVSVLNTRTRARLKTIPTGGLPCAVVVSADGKRAYVANANTDTVSILDTAADRKLADIAVGPYPNAPYGSIPNGLALSPNGKTLYVALAGNNAVVAYDTRTRKPQNAYPAGWYPTNLLCTRDGQTLYVINSKGVGSGPNANGGYIGHMMNGTLSAIPTQATKNGLEQVARNNGYSPHPLTPPPRTGEGRAPHSQALPSSSISPYPRPFSLQGRRESRSQSIPYSRTGEGRSRVTPFPPREGGWGVRFSGARAGSQADKRLPPITHCVLIVRENRTYDQVLGDRPQGNGDPSLTMFGAEVTPNLHALADRFATGDNFYSDGEISAQGHQWTLGANCPDYVEKTWMAYYTPRGRLADSPLSPISYPALGYSLDHCVRHGVSCRMYGDVVRIGKGGRPLPGLADKYDPHYRGWDLEYPDTQRAEEWLREFKSGLFPAFSYIWLPNDHTAGARLGSRTPRAMVADNDVATGRIIEAISHSRYWRDTAIFVCEDDSQDGRDHVDAHRNILLIASPWVRPGAITSHHYSQAGLYATIERLLHLPPMSQYDDLADPILDVWTAAPDLRPYDALPARIPTDERNTRKAAMWRESARLDLEDADADKTGLLEAILWRMEAARRKEGLAR